VSTKDWFNLSMKVLMDRPVDLKITYTSGDTGRMYAVALDDIPVQVKPVLKELPDGTVEGDYQIPLALTHGRRTVIVSFQSQRWFEGKKLLSCEMHGASGRSE